MWRRGRPAGADVRGGWSTLLAFAVSVTPRASGTKPFVRGPWACYALVPDGGVAEWSKAAVLKTADVHASGGSNPSASSNFFPLQVRP